VTTGLPTEIECAVSVLVFTLNEELNLEHCLGSLEWCDDVVVVDSFSTDRTIEVCAGRNVRSVLHEFRGFGDQRNWALREIPLKHEWVLILDADERVSPELALELSILGESAPRRIGAYRVRRRFHLWGRWLRHSSLYPTWVVRFVKQGRVRYVNRGHSETQEVDGDIGELAGHLIDENHKPLSAWLERQCRYAYQEAAFELAEEESMAAFGDLFSRDPMRRRSTIKRLASGVPFRAFFYFVYCYFFRMGFLDGRNGFAFCRMKAIYQSMIAVNKHEIRMRNLAAENERERHENE